MGGHGGEWGLFCSGPCVCLCLSVCVFGAGLQAGPLPPTFAYPGCFSLTVQPFVPPHQGHLL